MSDVGAERLGARELVVAARGHENESAVHFGESERENRDAAGAENATVSPALMRPVLDQRVPCRERGAGQGGGFLEAEMSRES